MFGKLRMIGYEYSCVNVLFNKEFMNIKKILTSGLLKVIVSGVRFFACAAKQIQCLDVDEFEKQINTTKGEQLIDVCTQEEFNKCRIPGAKNIDFRKPGFRSEIEKLDRTEPILVYCLSGVRSKLTASTCKKAGFENICELDQGLRKWVEAGKPVEIKN